MTIKLAAGIPAIVLLSACTGLTERIEGNVDQAGTRVSSLVQETGRTAPGVVAKPPAPVAHEPGIWLGKNIVKLSPAVLPSVFYEDATFDRTVVSLAELAERITLRSGIPTKVSPDAQAFLDGEAGNRNNAQAGSAPAESATHRPPPVQRQMQPAGTQTSTNNDSRQPIRVAYANGDFKGLLDTAAARFGVSWKYENGTIHFYHTDSRTFQINSLPGASSYSATVASGATSTGGVSSGSGSGSGSGGESNGITANNSQNTAVTTRMSVYESIENAVQAMLSPYGRVVASPATGTMTVVDTPDALERVASYIEKENAALSRQVVINVTVLSVNLEDSDKLEIDWQLVYQDLSKTYDLGITSVLPTTPAENTFGVGIVRSSRFSSNSGALISALSRQGKVRRQTTASVVTLNNQPVPVQVARQTSYLKSMTTSVVAQVGTSTTLTPGTVTSGFNMSILPHVLTNGTVLLQFSTDISALRDIREVESGTSRIEVPELDTRNFLQRVAMKSGETLIISGFEQTDENLARRGTGAPNNYLFGGGFGAQRNKESIVILITPTTLGA